jgi:hypothetical protein
MMSVTPATAATKTPPGTDKAKAQTPAPAKAEAKQEPKNLTPTPSGQSSYSGNYGTTTLAANGTTTTPAANGTTTTPAANGTTTTPAANGTTTTPAANGTTTTPAANGTTTTPAVNGTTTTPAANGTTTTPAANGTTTIPAANGTTTTPAANGTTTTPAQQGGVGKQGDTVAQGNNVIEVKPGDNIQGAIDGAAEGSVIRFAPGTYDNASLKLSKGVTLDGSEGTIFNGNGSTAEGVNLAQGTKGATIQDIDFQNYSETGIYGQGIENTTIQNLSMEKIGANQGDKNESKLGTGINLLDSKNGVISNVSMNDIKNKGIGVNGGDGNVIRNNDIQNINMEQHYNPDWNVAGIKSFQADNVIVENNRVGNVMGKSDYGANNGYGIWIDTNGEGNVVQNNTTHGNTKSDIFIEKTARTQVLNNSKEDGDMVLQLTELSHDGLVNQGNAVAPGNVVIEGNMDERMAGGLVRITPDFIFGGERTIDPSKAGTFGFESPNLAKGSLNVANNQQLIQGSLG